MLAIIPARGGSKGVPKKNIKDLSGVPLISHTIEAAKKSKYISNIIVSTDSEEIAKVAKKYGAEVPFLRPAELASDHAKAIDAYLYTVEKLNQSVKDKIDNFIVLQPTSPLRKQDDIDNAISIFNKEDADSVISVTEAQHPPQWYKKITEDGNLVDYYNDENNLNRQEYGQTYLPNGAIYIFKYALLKKTDSYYTEKTLPYIMSDRNSIDIDTPFDFKMAEFFIGNS